MSRTFRIQGKVWRYKGPAGWFFVNVGQDVAQEIRFFEDLEKTGWGYIKVSAQVGRTRWKTTLFPTKEKDFLLAIKASVRNSEGIGEGDLLDVAFTLLTGVQSATSRASLMAGKSAGPNISRRPKWPPRNT